MPPHDTHVMGTSSGDDESTSITTRYNSITTSKLEFKNNNKRKWNEMKQRTNKINKSY